MTDFIFCELNSGKEGVPYHQPVVAKSTSERGETCDDVRFGCVAGRVPIFRLVYELCQNSLVASVTAMGSLGHAAG